MFSRLLGAPLLLGAAIAIPYLSSNGPEAARNFFHQSSPAEPEPPVQVAELPTTARFDPAPRGPGHEIYPVTTPLEGSPNLTLDEVFRFDITKEWVYGRWARKSTALAELGLFGVRVPLVTGTEIHDLAGSLTYFFDGTGRLERISFKGHTGDTTRIVNLVNQHHGLQVQPTAIAGHQLLQLKRGTDVISELVTQPASVLWSSSPHDSFAVDLQLQRPDATTPLPSRLPPLPEVQPPPPSTADAASADGAATSDSGESGFRESIKAFFPRSRVPGGQVDNLERRDRYW